MSRDGKIDSVIVVVLYMASIFLVSMMFAPGCMNSDHLHSTREYKDCCKADFYYESGDKFSISSEGIWKTKL